jgi:hypothetical protein
MGYRVDAGLGGYFSLRYHNATGAGFVQPEKGRFTQEHGVTL